MRFPTANAIRYSGADQYSYGVSDRGASVRIPWQVAKDKQGYIEDRRPNANADPYVTTRLILETICGAREAQPASKRSSAHAAKRPSSRRRKVAA